MNTNAVVGFALALGLLFGIGGTYTYNNYKMNTIIAVLEINGCVDKGPPPVGHKLYGLVSRGYRCDDHTFIILP